MKFRKTLFFIIPLVLLLLMAAACAAETEYADKKYGFSITYPSSCRVVKNYGGAPIIIFLGGDSFFVSDNIVVNVTDTPHADRPLTELVDIYFKYDRTVSERREVLINGIGFLSVVQTQTKPFLFFRFNLKLRHLITARGRRLYTITYTAAAQDYDRYAEEADRIMGSFRFTGK